MYSYTEIYKSAWKYAKVAEGVYKTLYNFPQTYIQPDDGYIYIYLAETCRCFYRCDKSCV
jgi:hypothetical protein